MICTLYRGDERSKSEIESANGFAPRTTVELTQVKNLLRLYTSHVGDEQLDIRIVPLKYRPNKGRVALLDLTQAVKAEKGRDTIQVSTDVTDECGGYEGGYVYEIQFPALYAHRPMLPNKSIEMGTEVTDVEGLKDNRIRGGGTVLTDTGNLITASVVAVACRGNEVYFLTPIPKENITRYKPKNEGWQAFN